MRPAQLPSSWFRSCTATSTSRKHNEGRLNTNQYETTFNRGIE